MHGKLILLTHLKRPYQKIPKLAPMFLFWTNLLMLQNRIQFRIPHLSHILGNRGFQNFDSKPMGRQTSPWISKTIYFLTKPIVYPRLILEKKKNQQTLHYWGIKKKKRPQWGWNSDRCQSFYKNRGGQLKKTNNFGKIK